jgi:hypothetical protein
MECVPPRSVPPSHTRHKATGLNAMVTWGLRLRCAEMATLHPHSSLDPIRVVRGRYALERELHEVTAKAMHAPAASLAEAKALRLQLADQQRQRSAAELRELVRRYLLWRPQLA